MTTQDVLSLFPTTDEDGPEYQGERWAKDADGHYWVRIRSGRSCSFCPNQGLDYWWQDDTSPGVYRCPDHVSLPTLLPAVLPPKPSAPLTGAQLLGKIEGEIFEARGSIDALWLRMGELCSEVVRHKLYKFKQDENGNYYRTARAYFEGLEKEFKEKGQRLSYTSLNRFVSDHRLYREDLGFEETDMLKLGKSNLDAMAPTVRKMLKEGGKEVAHAFVDDILQSAIANGGLPLHEVEEAVNEETGRVMKGLELEFKDGLFGKGLKKLVLWWGGSPIDLLHSEVTEEQAGWIMKRMGIKPPPPSTP